MPGKSAKQGARMAKRLEEIKEKSPIVGDVRTMGSFIGVELVKDKKTKEPNIDGAGQVHGDCLDNGVFFGVSNMAGFGNVIKIKAPFVITDEQVDKAMDVLEAAIKKAE
jgi:4-aminobutyrate aminotransferase-like enzyme